MDSIFLPPSDLCTGVCPLGSERANFDSRWCRLAHLQDFYCRLCKLSVCLRKSSEDLIAILEVSLTGINVLQGFVYFPSRDKASVQVVVSVQFMIVQYTNVNTSLGCRNAVSAVATIARNR